MDSLVVATLEQRLRGTVAPGTEQADIGIDGGGRACDGHMLQALSDFAFTTAFSVSGCWARSFYDSKRHAGCDHHESLRAVALRWVKIMWRMWNDNTQYDEDYHRRRKGAATRARGESG